MPGKSSLKSSDQTSGKNAPALTAAANRNKGRMDGGSHTSTSQAGSSLYIASHQQDVNSSKTTTHQVAASNINLTDARKTAEPLETPASNNNIRKSDFTATIRSKIM
jgi:hypothetical protein